MHNIMHWSTRQVRWKSK